MAACGKGFLNIVQGLHGCPFLDINHQDSEGNTALMIASQAGTDGLRKFTKRRLLLLFTPVFPFNVLWICRSRQHGHVSPELLQRD